MEQYKTTSVIHVEKTEFTKFIEYHGVTKWYRMEQKERIEKRLRKNWTWVIPYIWEFSDCSYVRFETIATVPKI